jgi:RHS repeat-associated protein
LISETRNGQTTTYRPNAQDRLATLTLPGAPPVEYAYDSEGKRVERRTPTELTRFGWDGETLRRETNAANNVIEAHDWAAGRILSSRRLADTRYAQHDALRSPIRWSQRTGTEQGQLRYDAWGETTETHPDLPRIAYTGHYREREGSSYYAQQRYYRPGLGRFNRIDPWSGDEANPITLNKYLYANGNPLAYVDPDGRQAMGETLADRHFMEVAASGNYSQEEIQALAHRKMEIEAELSAESLPYVALAVPGTLLAKGLWSVGRATYGAYRAGGTYHAANVAAVEGAALTESAILTGVGAATGAEVPSVMSAPTTATRRLMQTAGGLDASLDALQPLQRVASQAELPMPQASLLSSSAAANRVQRAQPVRVVEPGDGSSAATAEDVAPGSVSFIARDDRFLLNASDRTDIDSGGLFDVVAHGSPHKIQIETAAGPVIVDHRIAARLIEQSPGYSGQGVRLLSCSTGACDVGFAQNLANKMGVEVHAPTDLLWAYPDGRMLVAPQGASGPDLNNLGGFRVFSPQISE